MGLLGSAAGLRRVVLPQPSPEAVQLLLQRETAAAIWDISFFGDLPRRLQQYWEGEEVSFPDKVDLFKATPFQRAVWQLIRSIPPGETRSYGWVAEQIGKPRAARAVGQALARNPLPIIIPCHRVVAADGSLGGFNGGTELKQHLLNLEAEGRGKAFVPAQRNTKNARQCSKTT
jgi:methylated-DNA-[protein]-cysteine S-methyltransferase